MYDVGDAVRLTYTLTDVDGAPANGTVTLTVTAPDLTVTTPAVTNPAVGSYRADVTLNQEGRWTYLWQSTGAVVDAQPGSLDVASATPQGIVSLSDAKAHLNITDTTDDEELRTFIDAASQWVEHRVGAVVRRTVSETAYANGNVLLLSKAPVISVTSIAGAYGYSDTYSTAVGSIYVDSDAGIVHLPTGQSWSTSPLTVTYVAGRTVVPAALRLACLMYLKALWETQRGPGLEPQFQGPTDDVVAQDNMGLAVWRAEKLLEPYRAPAAIA